MLCRSTDEPILYLSYGGTQCAIRERARTAWCTWCCLCHLLLSSSSFPLENSSSPPNAMFSSAAFRGELFLHVDFFKDCSDPRSSPWTSRVSGLFRVCGIVRVAGNGRQLMQSPYRRRQAMDLHGCSGSADDIIYRELVMKGEPTLSVIWKRGEEKPRNPIDPTTALVTKGTLPNSRLLILNVNRNTGHPSSLYIALSSCSVWCRIHVNISAFPLSGLPQHYYCLCGFKTITNPVTDFKYYKVIVI